MTYQQLLLMDYGAMKMDYQIENTKKNYLAKDNWVSKRNILNEMRANKMTLQEIRFFSIYLSKINPSDSTTRVIKFTLNDFIRLMDIDRVRIEKVKITTDSLLCKIITVPNESGGYSSFQLFKECDVYKENNNWFVKIDAHDKALPLLFDFKEKYFKYRLWNALNLTSAQQIRIYEILKQYENVGVRKISLEELKKMIGISPNKYPRFNSFREWVLDRAQIALAEKTDICFDYKTIAPKGRKVLGIEFHIYKNKRYIHKKTTLEEFIAGNNLDDNNFNNDCEEDIIDYQGYADILENEFSIPQVELLYQMAIPIISKSTTNSNEFIIKMCNYFRLLYKRLKSSPNKVKHKFAYVKKLIECDLDSR